MDLGSDQSFSAQVGRIGKPDTGVHVFSGAGGGAVGHFFGNHRDVVADENAGFPAGQGDDPGGGQDLGLPFLTKSIEFGLETCFIAVAQVEGAAPGVSGTVFWIRQRTPVPLQAQFPGSGFSQRKDPGFQGDLAGGMVQCFQGFLQPLGFQRISLEQDGIGFLIPDQGRRKKRLKGFCRFLGWVFQRMDGQLTEKRIFFLWGSDPQSAAFFPAEKPLAPGDHG